MQGSTQRKTKDDTPKTDTITCLEMEVVTSSIATLAVDTVEISNQMTKQCVVETPQKQGKSHKRSKPEA